MASGLGGYTQSCIDQQDRGFCGRRTGGHVACVLFVAGRVSDDKFTF